MICIIYIYIQREREVKAQSFVTAGGKLFVQLDSVDMSCRMGETSLLHGFAMFCNIRFWFPPILKHHLSTSSKSGTVDQTPAGRLPRISPFQTPQLSSPCQGWKTAAPIEHLI
jgi:hypothetical protein